MNGSKIKAKGHIDQSKADSAFADDDDGAEEQK